MNFEYVFILFRFDFKFDFIISFLILLKFFEIKLFKNDHWIVTAISYRYFFLFQANVLINFDKFWLKMKMFLNENY